MTDKFDDTIARIDRTSPSLAEALPGIVRLFKMHEDKLAEFDQRIEKTNVDIMKKLDGLADHLDESRHRLHGSINHTDERATEALNGVKRAHGRIDFLEDRMTGMEARVPGPINNTIPAAQTRDLENLTLSVTEALDRLKIHWGYIEDLENRVDRLGTTPPAFDPARIDKLEQRFNALQTALAFKEPGVVTGSGGGGAYKPQRDTSWHPYDVLVEGVIGDHPKGDERVVVMIRGRDAIVGPAPATHRNWDEQGDSTIVAWRYAKEGE